MLHKYERLVVQLQNATVNKSLPWCRTSRANEFEAAIGDNSVSIMYHPKGSGGQNSEEYVSLFLWNRFGEVVDELRVVNSNNDYISLYSLFENVRSSSVRAEGTLDEILIDISKIG